MLLQVQMQMLWNTIMFYSKVRFISAFYRQNLAFPKNLYLWIHVTATQTNNELVLSSPIDVIKDWFQLHPSIHRWTPDSIKTKIMKLNGFEIRLETNFLYMYLWVHDKYSSTNFKQHSWQRKMLYKV